ncbi:restriction endonuclease subunit S [Vibrio parahaemolyticus]|nr:restriction endonuclease subunit S [Vibrio parahaemolyticus]EGQ9289588.1 restriction endonuclease subunit S [Vibrio parahaemolyticus]
MSKYQAYPEYKDSGVEWLGNIPSHWQVTPIKYLATLNPRKSAIDSSLLNKECNFLPMEKLKLNSIVLDEKRLVSDVYDGYTYFEDGDVLMAKVTPCFENKNIAVASGLVNGVGFGSSEIYVLRSNEKTDNRFLYYRLQEDSFMDIATAAMTGAGGLKRVPSEVVNGYSLGTPEVEEQTQIANFLDHETAKIDTLIEKQQQLIKLLKEKRQAVISHAVTKGLNPQAPMKDSGVEWLGEVPEHWDVSRIKYLSSIISKGTTPSTIGGDFVTEGIRFLKAENIGKSTSVKPFPEFFISEKVDAQLSRSRLKENDVLVIIAGATTGLASIVQKDVLPANTNQAVSFIRPVNPKLSYWIVNWLTTEFVQSTIWMGAVQAAQPNLSMEDLGNIPIVVPPESELVLIQESLKGKLATLDNLMIKAESAISIMQERRTALISAAVTGKIDVRNWQAPTSQVQPLEQTA